MKILLQLLDTKVVVGIAISIACFVILSVVFSIVGVRASYKRRLKELQRKYVYLHSLLRGQDSNYLKRVEALSNTNLLYVDKYDDCFRQFKELFESDDQFTASTIEEAANSLKKRKFKDAKIILLDAARAVKQLDIKTTKLDSELYELIKPEEESREEILTLKEMYRNTKQTYYGIASEIELCVPSFIKCFNKIDDAFETFETLLENGQYEEANSMIPQISKVIHAADKILLDVPNLCALTSVIVPSQIEEIQNEYYQIQNTGIPLQNLHFEEKVNGWKKAIEEAKYSLKELRIKGLQELLENIENEITSIRFSFKNEQIDKELFIRECERTYKNVLEIEKSFVRICSLLPQLKETYLIKPAEENKLNELKSKIEKLSASKRNLDNYVHAASSQPYSALMQRLNELKRDYDAAYKGIKYFKAYIDYLRGTADDAYEMMSTYYKRCVDTEYAIREIDVAALSANYTKEIENSYIVLDEMDAILKRKPIDVDRLNELMDTIKNMANYVFDAFENKVQEMRLAETAMLICNRDRLHRMDIHQQLKALEVYFNDGDFLRVYHEATDLYQKEHQHGVNNSNGIKK